MKIDRSKAQRQVPKRKEVTSNKLYTDILYAHLQLNATIQPDKTKFIPKSLVNFINLGAELGMSRQTISKKFRNLIECGLVTKTKNGYILRDLDKTEAYLLSNELLATLVSTLQVNTINIYIYLLNRYIANSQQEFDITLKQLKAYIGIANNTRGNDYIVIKILEILDRLGLIKHEVQLKDTTRRQYVIKKVTNELPEHITEVVQLE